MVPPLEPNQWSQLGAARAREQMASAPEERFYLPEAITAYRVWRMTDKGYLASTAMRTTEWPPGEIMLARCNANLLVHTTEPGAPPHWNPYHPCGIHAWKERDRCTTFLTNLTSINRFSRFVLGLVSLGGKVIECEQGYRAAKAMCVALSMYSPETERSANLLEKVANTYDVPIIPWAEI